MFDTAAVDDPSPSGWSDAGFARLRESLESGGLLLDLMRREQHAIGAAQARRARWVVGFCRSRPSSADRPDTEVGAAAAATRAARPSVLATVSEWAVDEVATALSMTSAAAVTWMVQSLQLVDRLPVTLRALERGRLTWEHAAAMCQVVSPLDDDELRRQAEERLLARLGRKTPTQLRAAAHRVVQRLDGQAIGRRVEEALRERGIAVHPTGDGLGSLSVTNLPLPVLRAVQDALRQYADAAQTPGDTRTRQQRMVDCLVDLVLRPGEHGLAPVQAQLTVVATVRTMLGGDDPGEVAGDVVPAETVRALARTLGLLPPDPLDPSAAAAASDADLTDARLPSPTEPPPATATSDADPTDARLPSPAEPPVAAEAQPDAASSNGAPTSTQAVTTDDASDAAPAGATTEGGDAARAGEARLTDLLGTRTTSGTALTSRPHIALVDELTGQLLALTDAAGLRAGEGLSPPPTTGVYSPSAELSRFVQRRDRRCRFPGCRRPGHRCDLHHVVRYPLGDTSAANLCCLCRHHHRLVHQAPGWELAALADGGLRFTTPTGQVVVTYPDDEHTDPPARRPPDRQSRDTHPPDTDFVRPPGDDPPPF